MGPADVLPFSRPSTTPPADRLGSGDGVDVAQTFALGGVAMVADVTHG